VSTIGTLSSANIICLVLPLASVYIRASRTRMAHDVHHGLSSALVPPDSLLLTSAKTYLKWCFLFICHCLCQFLIQETWRLKDAETSIHAYLVMGEQKNHFKTLKPLVTSGMPISPATSYAETQYNIVRSWVHALNAIPRTHRPSPPRPLSFFIPSSWTHRRYGHDDLSSWCADRGHGDPSSVGDHGERGSSLGAQDPHEACCQQQRRWSASWCR
jgi:hypothetical protein